MNEVDERKRFEQFVGHPVMDAQWELFKKVYDGLKKRPPDCAVKWMHYTTRSGYFVYYPEYVKKGEKSECNR